MNGGIKVKEILLKRHLFLECSKYDVCEMCERVGEEFEQVAYNLRIHDPPLKCAHVDVSRYPELAERFEIPKNPISHPILKVFRDGAEFEQYKGSMGAMAVVCILLDLFILLSSLFILLSSFLHLFFLFQQKLIFPSYFKHSMCWLIAIELYINIFFLKKKIKLGILSLVLFSLLVSFYRLLFFIYHIHSRFDIWKDTLILH